MKLKDAVIFDYRGSVERNVGNAFKLRLPDKDCLDFNLEEEKEDSFQLEIDREEKSDMVEWQQLFEMPETEGAYIKISFTPSFLWRVVWSKFLTEKKDMMMRCMICSCSQ